MKQFDFFDAFFTAAYFALGVSLGYVLFASGYAQGANAVYYGINKPHVRNRIVKEGNVISYPFQAKEKEDK